MFIVRFPNGVAITYNDANYLRYTTSGMELYDKAPNENGNWIACIQASAGATVERVPACFVENPVEKLTGENALKFVVEHVREFNTWRNHNQLKALKQTLAHFDARRGAWMD